MATFTKVILSGSTNGRGISVSATAGQVLLHTTASSTNVIDEIVLYAKHNYSQAVTVFLEWGNTAVNETIKHDVDPLNGVEPMIPGLVIRGAVTPLVVGAYVSASNSVTIYGYVNRITE